MATLDWSQCPAVESIADKVSGAWVIRGTRLPVATVIENLEDLSVEEVMEQFDVTREQMRRCLISWRRASRRHRRASRRSLLMLILFDHGTPKGLIRALTDYTVVTAQAKGWDRLNNSALLKAAEEAAVDLFADN
jgi:uncharacterized protein (DUF433 family)